MARKPKNGQEGSGQQQPTDKGQTTDQKPDNSGSGSSPKLQGGEKSEAGQASSFLDNNTAASGALANMLQYASDVTFAYPTGAPFALSDYDGADKSIAQYAVPGVASMYIDPCFGTIADRTSPLNVAADNMMSVLRRTQTSRKNYDQITLMFEQLGLSEAMSYVQALKFTYGLTNAYDARNRYINYGLISAIGVDYDDLFINRSRLLFAVNDMVYKLSTLVVPATMPLFERRVNIFTKVLREGEAMQSQLYVYRPGAFYQFVDENPSNPTGFYQLLPINSPFVNDGTPENLATVDELIKFGYDIINKLLWTQFLPEINGDVARAFGSQVIMLTPLQSDYVVPFTTDLTELEMFQNASLLGAGAGATVIVDAIKQAQMKLADDRVLRFQYFVSNSRFEAPNWAGDGHGSQVDGEAMTMLMSKRFVTTILTDPNPSDLLQRNFLMARLGQRNGSQWPIESSMMIADHLEIIQFDFNVMTGGLPSISRHRVDGMQLWDVSSLAGGKLLMSHLAVMRAFKFIPAIWLAPVTMMEGVPQTWDTPYLYFGFDHYTVMDVDDMIETRTALQNYIFNVPRL